MNKTAIRLPDLSFLLHFPFPDCVYLPNSNGFLSTEQPENTTMFLWHLKRFCLVRFLSLSLALQTFAAHLCDCQRYPYKERAIAEQWQTSRHRKCYPFSDPFSNPISSGLVLAPHHTDRKQHFSLPEEIHQRSGFRVGSNFFTR